MTGSGVRSAASIAHCLEILWFALITVHPLPGFFSHLDSRTRCMNKKKNTSALSWSLQAAAQVQTSRVKSEKYVLLLRAVEIWGAICCQRRGSQRRFACFWPFPIAGTSHQGLLDSSDGSPGCC